MYTDDFGEEEVGLGNDDRQLSTDSWVNSIFCRVDCGKTEPFSFSHFSLILLFMFVAFDWRLFDPMSNFVETICCKLE